MVENLSLDAWMLHRASEDSPPRFEVELTNGNDGPVTIGLGHTLFFAEPWEDRDLVLVPDNEFVHADAPDERTEGCWRSEGYVRINDHSIAVELEPDESVIERYSTYTHVDADDCLPRGEHVRRDVVTLHDSEADVLLEVTLRVDEDGTLSVDAADPALR